MKFLIIQYAKPMMYVILLLVTLTAALIILAIAILIEKFLGGRKPSLPDHYYRLTSWEDDQGYAHG